MLVPFNKKPVVALILATARVAEDPLSVRVSKVFGVPSASWIVSVPLLPAVAREIVGVLLVRASGRLFESVAVPEALIVVTPVIDPVLIMPPLILFKPPAIVAPPWTL